MGYTLAAVSTSISLHYLSYTLWGNGQFLVLIIGTRLSKDAIFVGDKEATLDALVAYFDVVHSGQIIWKKY